MVKDEKILILYASYGNGHYQVSRALTQGFLDLGYQNVKMVDLFSEAHPWINTLTRYIYNKSFSFASYFLYGWTYYLTQNMNNNRIWTQWFHSFGAAKLQKILKSEKPSLVVNTFPMQVLPELRKRKGLPVPNVTVLTDFCFHNRWMHTEIDRYYVPTEELMQELYTRGVPIEKIKISGIPIMKEFTDSSPAVHSCDLLGLNTEKKFCVVMANSYSRTLIQQICKTFQSQNEIEVVLVCGRNEKLKKELELSFSDFPTVHVLGYVEHMHHLMSTATFIITKAGGITLSEALAMNVPALIFQPLPGQERENARYLSNKGAAVVATNMEQLEKMISQLLSEQDFVHQLIEGIKNLRRPDATKTIVKDILNHFFFEPEFLGDKT